MRGAVTARRRRDPDATYESILAAARALMAERGPEAVTVSDVAHRAGVNRTTAYQHFRTREDLIAATVARLADELGRMLEAPMGPGERIDHMVEYYLEHPEVARLWMHQMLSGSPLPNREGWERYMRAMRVFTRSDQAREGIDPEMLGLILMSATLVWPLHARGEFADDAAIRGATRRFVREMKRLLLYGGLRPEKAGDVVEAVETKVRNLERRTKS